MNAKIFYVTIMLFMLVMLATACGVMNIPQTGGTPADSMDAIYTQAAQTVQAQLTQQAAATQQVSPTQDGVQPLPATATPTQQLPAPTATPTQQVVVVQPTPIPPTPLPPTRTPVPCDWAEFVRDLNIPDGTTIEPNGAFTKSWRLRNVGTCTWDDDYEIVFVDGNAMSTRAAWSMTDIVEPGETIDVSVNLVAPGREGSYRGYWMLRNDRGQVFGIGEGAQKAFWVDIRVAAPPISRYPLDFAATYCSAAWESSAGRLACPGNWNDEQGSINLLDRPEIETDRIEDELTLWMRPEETNNGWIRGIYPAYTVKAGDHFLADIGCLADNPGCDVTFSLDYQVGNSVRNLGYWREVYDGSLTRVDIDLTPLAGQSVQFILSVTANNRPSQANAFWLVPSIRAGQVTMPGSDIPAVQAARLKLANALGYDVSTVGVQSVEVKEWADSCLGVHIPDQVCAPAIIPGYRVILTANAKQYEAHTNGDGSIVFWFEY